jgi:hypothetical protein
VKNPTEWEEMFANHIFDETECKNFYNPVTKRQATQLKNGQRINIFPKKIYK